MPSQAVYVAQYRVVPEQIVTHAQDGHQFSDVVGENCSLKKKKKKKKNKKKKKKKKKKIKKKNKKKKKKKKKKNKKKKK